MAQRITIGGGQTGNNGSSKRTNVFTESGAIRRMYVSITFCGLAILIAFAVRYLWSLPGQADRRYEHEIFPVTSARHGFTEPLETENRSRKQQGQPPLAMPRDRHRISTEDKAELEALQNKLRSSDRQ